MPIPFGTLCGLAFIPEIQATFNFDSTGCVNPSAFNTCWSQATTDATTCWTNNCENAPRETCSDFFGCQSTSDRCTNACVCIEYAHFINCALENRWNQVMLLTVSVNTTSVAVFAILALLCLSFIHNSSNLWVARLGL